MTRSLLIKRCLVLLLMFALFSGNAVLAEEDSPAQLRVNFVDVLDNSWEQKHVSKLALLGVTNGYEDGTYRPRNTVTQQEVVGMVMRIMGYSDAGVNIEASQPNHIINFLRVNVAEWAQPWVSLAFDHGVLDYSFEASNIGASKWGEKPATREWVAKLVIQAIGEEDYAQTLKNTNSIFTDNINISAWALGYVNAAVEKGIVTGSDGKFNPQDFVTRAELAAFLSRGENHMTKRSELVKIGTLINFSLKEMTIMDETGKVETYTSHREQKYYSAKVPNDPISITQVKQYTKVAVIVKDGIVYYAEVIDDAQQLITLEGVLLDAGQSLGESINLDVRGQSQVFLLDPFVTVLNENNSGLTLRDLVVGSTLSVKFNTVLGETLTESSKVIEIKVLKAPINKRATGIVQNYDEVENKMTFVDVTTSAAETFLLSANVSVAFGNRAVELSNISIGDQVDYAVDNSLITSINIISSSNPYVEIAQGTIKSYNWNDRIVTILDTEGNYTTHPLSSQTSVLLKGHSAPTYKELEIEDIVKLQINSFGEVTRVEVLNREIMRMTQVEIVRYHEETSNLFVILDGKGDSFKIGPDTVILYGDQVYNVSNFDFDQHFVEGKKIDMTFTNDNLMEVKLSNYYDGVIKQINTTNRTITLASDGYEHTFSLPAYTAIQSYKSSSTEITDLKVGDTVRVNLNPAQTQVSHIQVKQTVLFRVIDTQLSTRMITVKDQSGDEMKLFAYGSIPMKHYAKTNPQLSDIKANDLLITTYNGITIESIEISEATVGTIREITPLLQKLTVNEYNSNDSKEWSWTTAPNVYDGKTNQAIALNTLRSGDRVQVVVDPNGQLFITTLELLEREFWKYNKDTNQVYYRGGQTGIPLSADAYITHDGKVISVTNLVGQGFPMVKFYMLNGIVYEIERN